MMRHWADTVPAAVAALRMLRQDLRETNLMCAWSPTMIDLRAG